MAKTKVLFVSIIFCLLFSNRALHGQKQICITVDDLPVVGYGLNSDADWKSVTDKLISSFKKFDIPAIGYVNESKLKTRGQLSKQRVALLELWLSNGYELGNHTYSHIDYHKTSFKSFVNNIMNGERIIRPLIEKYDSELRYFRHPFLRSGETKERSDSLAVFLGSVNYTASPVTLDSDDYLFASAYAKAFKKNDTALMQKIGQAYVGHTEKKLKFYEELTEAVFGRQISQTYLMHANMLNADYLDELAQMFKDNGYTFISQSEVLEDRAYQQPVTKFGNWGMSWLYRWALSTGRGESLFKNDVEVPKFIKEFSK